MEDSYTSSRPVAGRLVALEFLPARPLTFLGPTCAVLCGAIASGGLLLKNQSLLFVILLILLCDALLGAWRARWLHADWRSAVPHNLARAQIWLALPDDSAESLPVRITRFLSRRIKFVRSVIWPLIDSEIISMLVAGLLAVCIAIVLGVLPTILTGVALILALIEGQLEIKTGALLRAVFEITLPWLIAQSALGSLSWFSFAIVVCFTLVYVALLDLSSTRKERRVILSNAIQLVIVLLLIATNTPAGAGIVALGILAQILWQVRFRVDRDGRTYAQRVQSYILVSMLVTAFSLWL
ncbi:MAG: hypothetical protein HZB51_33250 [Chloroflexi bacterium]|nr:hypothetical protein [Chloroflexota bacterium]